LGAGSGFLFWGQGVFAIVGIFGSFALIFFWWGRRLFVDRHGAFDI